MKKLLLLIVSIVMFSCGKETAAEKPARLLSQQDMENILYDVTIMQAVRSYQPQVLDTNKVDIQHYVYKKYKIDSLTYAQNNIWYAAHVEKYAAMLDNVAIRVQKEKDAVTKKIDKEKKKDAVKVSPSPVSANIAKKDSLRKVVLGRTQRQQK